MRALLGSALAVALAAAAATAGGQKDGPIDPKKLVGTWEPAEAKKGTETRMEFTKDGKLAIRTKTGDKADTFDGTYKLDGNKLKLSVKLGEKTVDTEVVVLRLTDDRVETEDGKGKQETLNRVKSSK